jgi:hypothetical protein
MRAIPLRYLPWMIRDLVLAQGAVLAALALITGLIMARIDPAPDPASGPSLVLGALQQMALPFLLYCAAAIVSNDRVHGYYRSFFSRPLSPTGYYFTRWLLGGILYVLICPVLTLALNLAIGSFPLSWDLIGKLGLNYLLLGSLIFFFSSFTRGDWLLGLLVFIVQSVLHTLKRGGAELPDAWEFVRAILPPTYLPSLSGPFPAGAALTHVLLYGAGLTVAALALVHLRPLGVGGRS